MFRLINNHYQINSKTNSVSDLYQL